MKAKEAKEEKVFIVIPTGSNLGFHAKDCLMQ